MQKIPNFPLLQANYLLPIQFQNRQIQCAQPTYFHINYSCFSHNISSVCISMWLPHLNFQNRLKNVWTKPNYMDSRETTTTKIDNMRIVSREYLKSEKRNNFSKICVLNARENVCILLLVYEWSFYSTKLIGRLLALIIHMPK